MSDVAIRVENLSKQFVLGERIGVKTFRESLQDALTAPFRRWVKGDGQAVAEKVDTDREIWALKDVSFEVKHGEVLGIIGPNGAGKSTLLKILSRITEPTGGYAEIRGRVGSLLEVGTGFHPELTGRENVYLNGSILGMSKSEIRRKFDDIVSFAGVEKFIDTPVKRYSSGMQVRLAFAVAAHLDPEILIIDEVLAVGDAEFQKRCLGKMDEVSRSGRTILFVSHNMAAVEGLCTRGILLKHGLMEDSGQVRKVIRKYLNDSVRISGRWDLPPGSVPAGPFVRRVNLAVDGCKLGSCFPMGSTLCVCVELCNVCSPISLEISLRFWDSHRRRVLTCNNAFQHPAPITLMEDGEVRCLVRDCRLAPGTYEIEVLVRANGALLEQRPRLAFVMVPSDLYGTGKSLPSHTSVWSPVVDWYYPGRRFVCPR